MALHPYTANQFRILAAAFEGNYNAARFDSRRAKTRAINDMLSAKLVIGGLEGGELTLAGMRAYVDMCERYDADSGCIAYQQRAHYARCSLRSMEARGWPS